VKTTVVLGKGDLAIRVADWFRTSPEHELAAVVPVVPEPTWTSSMVQWCKQHNVPFVETGHFDDLPTVLEADTSIDLAVSVFYDKIIRQHFIDACAKIINLHNGPLPRYRGVSPINWALKNNESEHGVTIHEITAGVDDGPIVSQVKYSIFPELDEVEDVYKRALAFGWTLFEQTIPMLDTITPKTQDESQALHYTKKNDHDLGDRAGFRRW
jgi:methionyl-tRNA formyltransferase